MTMSGGKFVLALAALALATPAIAFADDDDDSVAHPAPPTAGVACGTTLWPVKTLSDPQAGAVDLTPRSTTIAALNSVPAPQITPQTGRIPGPETTTYRVRARLVGERRQRDHDIHLVLADPRTGQTMISEFPDPTCRGVVQSAQRTAMAAARSTLELACGPPPTGIFRILAGSAEVTGVGFLDEPHRPAQPGAAVNSVELHPVLGLSVSACRTVRERALSSAAGGD
jgi:hypothetical protein